jgi:exodeoxyribonuclease V alpha subunit
LNETINIKLKVVREIRYFDNTSYGIYACTTEETDKVKFNRYNNFTITGTTARLTPNTEYEAELIEREHPTYGHGYDIKLIKQKIPTTASEQRAFLSMLMTERQLNSLYEAYPNDDIVQLFREGKIDYNKVKYFGEKTYHQIRDRILENLDVQIALTRLGKYDISYNMIMKMVRHYGSAELLIQKIEENPYILAFEVSGIGFKKADAIAYNMGENEDSSFEYRKDNPNRIHAGIVYTLEENQFNGHTYMDKDELLQNSSALLEVSEEKIEKQLKNLNDVVITGDCVVLRNTFIAEKYVANRLKQILRDSKPLDFNVEEFIQAQEEKHGIKLTEQQKSFFYNIQQYGVNYLIGYAGCGKSMLQKLLIELLEEMNISYRLLAPTGKAAKVLAKYTQRDASTIHRAIGFKADAPIEERFIIVDESSMMGIKLCFSLLRNLVHPEVRVLFVGDDFQLPSVTEGAFLYDSIQSGVFPITKLDIVFRQSEGGILDIATKMRRQQKFVESSFIGVKEFGDNCVLYSAPKEKMIDGYVYCYNKLLERFHPDDIMVLSPSKNGDLGTFAINAKIQSIVNPPSPDKKEYQYGANTIFREHDNIINIRNTYQILSENEEYIDIVNGDTGKIEQIIDYSKEILIDYDFDKVRIKFTDLENILHNYCITIHKSQGSSAKAVLIVIDPSKKFFINANLLYTGFTRPEDYLIILGSADVINYAMRKIESVSRNTLLQEFLLTEESETDGK